MTNFDDNNHHYPKNNNNVQHSLFSNEHYLKHLPTRTDDSHHEKFSTTNYSRSSFPIKMNTKDKHSLIKTDGLRIDLIQQQQQTSHVTTQQRQQQTATQATAATPSRQMITDEELFHMYLTNATVRSPQQQQLNVGLNGGTLLNRVTPASPTSSSSSSLAQLSTAYGIRANEFVPISVGIFYFECTVLSDHSSVALSSSDLAPNFQAPIWIGFATANTSLQFQPGLTFAEKYTFLYESKSGNAYHSTNQAQLQQSGEKYSTGFSTGDTIGCCINFINQTIHFTRNGASQGDAFRFIPRVNLFPFVALSHHTQSIRVNFGSQPFLYPLEQVMNEARLLMKNSVQSVELNLDALKSISSESQEKATTVEENALTGKANTSNSDAQVENDFNGLMRQLVLSHLVYHGYSKTAACFLKDSMNVSSLNSSVSILESGESSESSPPSLYTSVLIEQMEKRKQAVHLIQNGQVTACIQYLNQWFPLLLGNFHLLFELKCLGFLESLQSQSLNETIQYGKQELVHLVEKHFKSMMHEKLSPFHSRHNKRQSLSSRDNTANSFVVSSDDEEMDSDDDSAAEPSLQRTQGLQVMYDKYTAQIRRLFLLLAYPANNVPPELRYLLQLHVHRNEVSQMVNRAILELESMNPHHSSSSETSASSEVIHHHGGHSALERMIAQSEQCLIHLSDDQSRQCGYSFISYRDLL